MSQQESLHFTMPVLEGNLFSDSTYQAIKAFFASQPRAHGQDIVALKQQIFIDRGVARPLSWFSAISKAPAGALREVPAYDITETTGPSASLRACVFEITQDSLHTKTIDTWVLPYGDRDLTQFVNQTTYSLTIHPKFCLLSHGKLGSIAMFQGEGLMFDDASTLAGRMAACSMILPSLTSAHEEIERKAALHSIEGDASRIFGHLIGGLRPHSPILSGLDFDNIHPLRTK